MQRRRFPGDAASPTGRERLGRVLVVEDEQDVAELIRFNLQREGYEVTVVGNGADGVRHAREGKPDVLPRMAEMAQRMVKESLDAFVTRDTELARRICGEDAAVDALKEQIFRELLTFMMADPRTIPRALRLILISRFMERVADHATNIAEMVVYMVEGKMVRHTLA